MILHLSTLLKPTAMKSKLFAANARIRIIAGVLATLCLTSCSGPNKVKGQGSTPTKWEAQLQHAQSLSAPEGSDQLALKGYKYLGKVKSDAEKSRLLDELFADDTYTLISLSADYSMFDFTTWSDYRKISPNAGKDAQRQVALQIVVGSTEVIELQWSYHGKTYRSKAMTNENEAGIFYDNVSTYAPYPKDKESDFAESKSVTRSI